MPPPMTPAPRTPTRAIFRGLTPAPGAPRASTPVSFLTSSIRKKRPMRLRMTGVPMSDPTPSTSNSSAFAKSPPNPFSTTPSAASGAGYWPFVSFRTDWRAFEKTMPLPGPSRNFSTSFGSWTRAGAPPGPAFERFFVPNFPRANAFAQSSRIACGTTSSTRPILFARFASRTFPARMTSRAFARPIMRGRRVVPPHAGRMPSLTSGRPI